LTNKQNVFDDFAACAQYLIDAGYTNPSKLAIRGGSNGGLLVGATMTQHPDLFRAVVCQKGVLDMLRVELDPNGEFNITEFGTVKDLSALVRLILGGELIEYTEMMGRARTAATNRMIAQAAEMGADAIINVRYMTTSVVGSAAELLAYGTAVKLSE
ncbi:unnamed protein product, partial [marine sediment metagenome]